MTKKFEYQLELNYDMFYKYFGEVLDSSYDGKISKGLVKGRPAYFKFDFEKVIISYEDSDECELFYFYPGDDNNKILSHYYIRELKKPRSFELSTSLIFEKEDGGTALETYKTGYVRDIVRFYDNYRGDNVPDAPGSFDDIYTDDIIGKDVFEIHDTITSHPALFNTSFEGDTGPYILYTIVRIKSILSKYIENGGSLEGITFNNPETKQEKNLMLELTKFSAMMENAFEELAPNKVCSYIYDLANCFNSFYHETKIMAEEDKAKQAGYIALLVLCRDVLEACIDVLGFSAPEKM